MDECELFRVAELLIERNQIDAMLGGIINRPPSPGHLGEWIASQIFHVRLEHSANAAAIDGHFAEGALADCSVNIKWYSKRSGILDLSVSAHPDYYLVMTGPSSRAATSAGQLAPARIDAVYLFMTNSRRRPLEQRQKGWHGI